jgi:Na+-driven multidrug efflux pump
VTGTTIVALISVIASAIVALTGVIVPQVLGARERRVAHFLAHEIWWRDTRAPVYSEILSFCIRAEQEK